MTPPGDHIPGPKDTTDLQADIDSLLKDVEQTTGRIEAHVASMPTVDIATAAPTTTLPADPATTALAAHVNGLLNTPPREPAPDPLAAIETLDAQLAELTAQLLDNKPAPAPQPEPMPSFAAPASAPLAPPAEPDLVEPSEPPGTNAAPPTKPAPIQPSQAAAVPNPATHPTQAEPVSQAESESLNNADPDPAQTPREPGPILKALAALSKPLASKPKSVYAAAGFLAVWTLLVALLAWGWVLLRPVPKAPESPAFNLGSDVLPRPVEPHPKAATPAAGHDAHAPPDAHTDAHAAPKAKTKPANKPAGKKAGPPKSSGH